MRTQHVAIGWIFSPHGLLESLAGNGGRAGLHQHFQQLAAGRVQVQRLASTRGLQSGQVQAQVLDFQHLAAVSATCAGQQRFHAHFQFGQGERLGQVVVGTGTEAGDLVRQFIARGQHDHRHARSVSLAQASQHFVAFHARQHPVQDDDVIGLGGGQVQAGNAVRGGIQHMAARLEILEEVGDQAAVVFDYQQPHGYVPVQGNE